MPYGDFIAINPVKVSGSLVPIQKAVEDLIRAIRATEKAQKDLLEAEKDLNMFVLKGHSEDLKRRRRQWLENNYVPVLRQIGLTRETLRRRLGNSLRVTQNAITTLSGEKLFDLFEGDDAFEEIMLTEAVARRVYRKKGTLQQRSVGEKHYVQDDCGRFTRRFAYVEKPIDVFELLLVQSKIVGKAVAQNPALGGDPYAKGDFAKAKYDFPMTGNQPRMEIEEMVFVNQEDGSTTQRGLALTSTTKNIHGNQGFRFGNPQGVCLKIDLALIPNESTNLLLNLHSFEAQRDTIGLTTYNLKGKKRGAEKSTALESKAHTDGSTSKNREVVLLRLPLFAIRAVIFHDPSGEIIYGELLRRWVAEDGGRHYVETGYAPHGSVSPDELFED